MFSPVEVLESQNEKTAIAGGFSGFRFVSFRVAFTLTSTHRFSTASGLE
jgi:hypothetical protein